MISGEIIYPYFASWLGNSATAALLFSGGLLTSSILHFGRTGPAIKDEVLAHFTDTLVFGLTRLTFWSFIVSWYWAAWGVLTYTALSLAFDSPMPWGAAVLSGLLCLCIATSARFLWVLYYSPATISTSFNYSNKRLCAVWKHLTSDRLRIMIQGLVAVPALAILISLMLLLQKGYVVESFLIPVTAVILIAIAVWANWDRLPKPLHPFKNTERTNIIMLGSDTLRADRIGKNVYPRTLTPFLNNFLNRSVQFTNCYIPCARTAPSVASLFTGSWPQHHGVRDNFIADDKVFLPIAALPEILKNHGWKTAVTADWAGSDLGKLSFGFEDLDVPPDQWNLRFLLRQGPKDLRLFLSLFGHNRWCKKFLPEIYYLAGVPLNRQVSTVAQRMINKLAMCKEPFFLNVFMAATHPPFGSEYPYYNLFSNPEYMGDSKFVMGGLDDPFDIIRRQGEPREEFDLEQIIDLYDGCVRSFDDEVKKIVEHVEACGLSDNTIIVIYSDHGFEFFEHDTWGQGNSAQGEASPKIPLIISAPGIEGAIAVDHVVRSIDVAPTLLDLIGIAPPDEWDGVSLLSYLKGERKDLDLPAYNETGIWLTRMPGMPEGHLSYPNLMELLEIPNKHTGTMAIKPAFQKIVIQAKDRMLRIGQWKLVCQPLRDGYRFMLFDLYADPQCLQDVGHLHPEKVEDLKQKLQLLMEADRMENMRYQSSHFREHQIE